MACTFACYATHRQVHAVDPNPENANKLKCAHPNFESHNYVVYSQDGWLTPKFDKYGFIVPPISPQTSGEIEVKTLDTLFTKTWNRIPGFMHINVQGHEWHVLRGAKALLESHQPVYTVQASVLGDKTLLTNILTFSEKYGYHIYMVNEVCGVNPSCRNFIAIYHEHRVKGSPGLDLATRSHALVKVNSNNVIEKFQQYQHLAHNFSNTQVFV